MRKLYLLAMSLLFISLLGGCASTSMLPQTANDVIFAGGKEGKVGWSSYREEAIFKNADQKQVIQAAKAGLGHAGFALKHVNNAEGVVFGEHGITLHDWNIIAGVYIKEKENDTLVVVLVEGSKDIGFSGDVTGGGWTGKILKGMRDYLGSNGYGEQLGHSIQDLAQQLSAGLKKPDVSRIAILPFIDVSRQLNTPFGNYLAEKLTVTIYSNSSVTIVERSQLDRVVEELALSMSARFDEASAKRIGGLLGVDAVIIGMYAELGPQTLEANARIVSVETGEVLGAGIIQIPRAPVQELLQ